MMKKKMLIFGGIIIVAFVLFVLFFKNGEGIIGTPTLIVETPQKISASDKEIFTLDLTITSLGKAIYPAASFSISFDSSRLEFMGIEEGNVFVKNDVLDTAISQKLPEWSYNTEMSNKNGEINIMYLDTTGGKNAFSRELLAEDDNVILRLSFRLRGSARTGDVYDLIVEDAVFAASDETQSLSVLQKTLKIKDGRIIVGE